MTRLRVVDPVRLRRAAGGLVCLVLVVCPTDSASQGFRGEAGMRWASLSSGEANSISGVVIDAATGTPIDSAIVFLPLIDIGTLTDPQGRFKIVNVASLGPVQLVAQRIGYAQVSDTVRLEAGEGLVAYIGLSEAEYRDCEFVCTGNGCPTGVVVAVHDLATGRAPSGEVTLSVRSQGLVETFSERTNPERMASLTLFAGRRLGVPGPFDVEVSSRGYETWTASPVWLHRSGCWGPTSDVLHVWLIPRD